MRPLRRDPATTLQLNIGLYCNQACSHCHVESSPLRKEMMDRQTAERCMALLKASKGSVRTLDLTGGAPELNSQFRSDSWPCAGLPDHKCSSFTSIFVFSATANEHVRLLHPDTAPGVLCGDSAAEDYLVTGAPCCIVSPALLVLDRQK